MGKIKKRLHCADHVCTGDVYKTNVTELNKNALGGRSEEEQEKEEQTKQKEMERKNKMGAFSPLYCGRDC